jgi:hypothetical protein
MGTVEDWTG